MLTGGTAATVWLSDGNDLSNVNLTLNTLTVGSNSMAAVSNANLFDAKGSLTDPTIPYTTSGNNIHVSNGVAFQTASNTYFTVNGNIGTVDAPLTLSSAGVLAVGNNNLDSSGGNITLNGVGVTSTGGTINSNDSDIVVNAGGGVVNLGGALTAATAIQILNASTATLGTMTTDPTGTITLGTTGNPISGEVKQTGVINTGSLTGYTRGKVTLDGNNIIPNLGPFTNDGDFTFKTTSRLSVNGELNSINGALSLTAGDLLNLGSHNLSGNGITLNGVGVTSTGGNINSGHGDILVNAGGGTVSLAGALIANDTASTIQILKASTADLGNMTTDQSGTITLGKTGNQISGAVKQTGFISTGTLTGVTGGTVTLDAANNGITHLGAFASNGDFTLNNAIALNITGAVNTNGHIASLTNGDTLTLAAGGSVTGSSVSLTSTGSSSDVVINNPITWADNGALTLQAGRNIQINSNLTASGNSPSLTLAYGSSGNDYFLNNGSVINLPASSTTLHIGPTGNLSNYTVLNSLGIEGDTSGATLQGMQGYLSRNYALGSNIDASATSGWNSGAGFNPVGSYISQFTGNFHGLGHTISGLTINRPATNLVGLFGFAQGSILRNIGLTGGAVTGHDSVGALVGAANHGSIANAYNTGTVSGNQGVGGLVGVSTASIANAYSTGAVSGSSAVGGLVGGNSGNITNSYSTGAVSGSSTVGGLVGVNSDNITNSYSTGAVSGTSEVGGLVGGNRGNITNSYSTGAVSGTNQAGGLVGGNRGNITNNYSTGAVSGTNQAGGLVGTNDSGTVTNSYWDAITTGVVNAIGSNGGTSSNVFNVGNAPYAQSSYSAFDFNNTWWISDGNTRPFLRSEYSTTITNAHQLQLMAINPAANYTLVNNINMGELQSASGLWNTTTGFVPVVNFTGLFNGGGYVISGLTINQPNIADVGLFGDASGTISNVGLVGGSVSGQYNVGGLAGVNYGSISNVYNTGTITVIGTNLRAAGLVGLNYGSITNAYSSSTVNGNGDIYSSVGGLVGENIGSINNAYSTGTVSSNAYVGGLVGFNSGSITNAYNTGTVSGEGGLVGWNDYGGSITNAYNTGTVSGTGTVGGLVGVNHGSIANAYSTGIVNGNGAVRVGGLVGLNYGSITNAYSTGLVNGIGASQVGGLVGLSSGGTVTGSFWDTTTSTILANTCTTPGICGIGMATTDMMNLANFTSATQANGNVNPNWNFTGTWWMSDGNTRPFLLSEYSTTITNAHQLQLMAVNLNANYTLANNINLGELPSASGLWNTATGFVPVGNATTNFTGSFNGGGYTISGLTINRPSASEIGLFGVSGGTISNVGLVGGNVTGQNDVGGLAGS